MRISTSTMFASGAGRISDLQSGLMRTQQQVASNRRMLAPSDDPIASARALEVTQGREMNAQLATNRLHARHTLVEEEGVLASVTSLVQEVQTLAVTAGNGTLDDAQRQYLAIDLQARFDQMLGLANSRDGTGNFLFAGYDITTEPFGKTPQGAAYRGDQGQRALQVGPSRNIAISDPGNEVFERVRSGNGSFVAAADPANLGGGVVGLGAVTDRTALTQHDYRIDFHVTGGVTTYDVVDLTAGLPALSSGNAFQSGDMISVDGMQFDIKGAPADGDRFTIAPSRDTSVFATLRDLIDVLGGSAKGVAGQARLSNGLVRAGAGLAGMLDNVLSVRAALGARLKELDSLDNDGSQRDIAYAQTLSDLQDVDYAKTITELTQQQTTLEAAQKSFVSVSSLSLFKFI